MPEIVLQPLPPEEAIAYFRAKGFRPTWRWTDMWQDDHAQAFTVAKATRLDILQDIRDEIDRALAEGTTYQEFKKRVTPILQEKGWWGKHRVEGPQGPEIVQLGSPRRLNTIFATNIQTALQVGHYRQMTDPAVLKARPYWRYSAVLDSRTRPMHRAWHGTILPADDPWWSTHYPPNGWRCRCTAVTVSQGELDRGVLISPDRGITHTVTPRPDNGTYGWTNPHTGEILTIPRGIDPGWAYNPGKVYRQPDLDRYDDKIAALSVTGGLTGEDFTRFFQGDTKGAYPVAVLDARYRALIGANTKVVRLSDETLAKNRVTHPELSIAEYRQLPEIIADAQTIVQDGPLTLVFIRRGDRIYHAVVKATTSGRALWVTSFRTSSLADVERMRQRGRVLKDEL